MCAFSKNSCEGNDTTKVEQEIEKPVKLSRQGDKDEASRSSDKGEARSRADEG